MTALDRRIDAWQAAIEGRRSWEVTRLLTPRDIEILEAPLSAESIVAFHEDAKKAVNHLRGQLPEAVVARIRHIAGV